MTSCVRGIWTYINTQRPASATVNAMNDAGNADMTRDEVERAVNNGMKCLCGTVLPLAPQVWMCPAERHSGRALCDGCGDRMVRWYGGRMVPCYNLAQIQPVFIYARALTVADNTASGRATPVQDGAAPGSP